jgi:hypothetical protein
LAPLTMFVHLFCITQLDRVPHRVLYQLALVNGGELASPEDDETFCVSTLGLSKDDYHATLCEIADEIGGCGSL